MVCSSLIFLYISGSNFPSLKNKKNPLSKSLFLAPSLESFSYFSMVIISGEVRKIPVLAFVRFRRGRIGALRKKLLEHFTTIFSILNDIIVYKIEDSGKF